MNEAAYATQAHILITIIAALIPLLIWAFRDAEPWFAARRAHVTRRDDDRR